MTRQLITIVIALAACCFLGCEERQRKSAHVSAEEWDTFVGPIRESISQGGGEGGAAAQALEPTGWATIKGKFVYDGNPPTMPPINILGAKETQVCGAINLREETLVVDSATKGIANVFLFLKNRNVTPHEEYLAHKDDTVTLMNDKCHFIPHAMGIWLPQTLKVGNDDPFGHNTNCNALGDASGSFNDSVPAGGSIQKQFSKRQDIPVAVSCTIHPWMKGYVLPRDNPYFAVTGTDGSFEIKNVPAGIPLEFQVWQEKAGNLPAKAEWSNGRFKVTLQAGADLDLGEIRVSPALFGQ